MELDFVAVELLSLLASVCVVELESVEKAEGRRVSASISLSDI